MKTKNQKTILKIILLSVFVVICSSNVFSQEACDVIMLKNGDEIKGKVTELSSDEIKYKKCGNLSGPTYILQKQDVFMIEYSGGTKEIISAAKSQSSAKSSGKSSGKQFYIGRAIFTLGYGIPDLARPYLDEFSRNSYNISSGSSQNQKGFGPMHFRFDYGISDFVGLGFSVNYDSYNASWIRNGYDPSTGWSKNYYETLDYSSVSFMPRFNLHFGGTEKLDTYWGIAAGYKSNTYKFHSTDPNYYYNYNYNNGYILFDLSSNNRSFLFSQLGFETTVGMRYYFTSNFGAYMEMGFAKSFLQGGLAATF